MHVHLKLLCKHFESSFVFLFQGLLLRDKGPEAYSLDQVVQQKNLPENQQEAFKIGFTDGFMRAQALTQRTQGM